MIYAFICTRSKNITQTTAKLSKYLGRCGISTKFLVNQKSIFDGYADAFDKFEVKDDDIVIMCHDDIEILTDPELFKNIIVKSCMKVNAGFVGVAGTTHLSQNAVWWDQRLWGSQKHRGHVYHGHDVMESSSTYYGPPGRVVCMDGLFLAARGSLIKEIGLRKPEYLKGEWDFYDIYYTTRAHYKGYENQVVPISVLHNSHGTPREPWEQNRQAFIKNNRLPIVC